jgi:PEP-CTERM motif
MKKTLLLSTGMLVWLVQSASAQTLYTTTDDFAQFQAGTAVTSSLFYSESSTVNGIGNTSNAGGTGGIGSLQVSGPTAWGPLGGTEFPGQTQASFAALAPGSTLPWSAESGYGPGNFVAYSGTLTLDVYRGALGDWSQFGLHINSGTQWSVFFGSESDFTGADGNTWTHYVIPYSIAPGSSGYFQATLGAQGGGNNAGTFAYVDNIQVTVVPEPGVFALLGLGVIGFLVRRRRST